VVIRETPQESPLFVLMPHRFLQLPILVFSYLFFPFFYNTAHRSENSSNLIGRRNVDIKNE